MKPIPVLMFAVLVIGEAADGEIIRYNFVSNPSIQNGVTTWERIGLDLVETNRNTNPSPSPYEISGFIDIDQGPFSTSPIEDANVTVVDALVTVSNGITSATFHEEHLSILEQVFVSDPPNWFVDENEIFFMDFRPSFGQIEFRNGDSSLTWWGGTTELVVDINGIPTDLAESRRHSSAYINGELAWETTFLTFSGSPLPSTDPNYFTDGFVIATRNDMNHPIPEPSSFVLFGLDLIALLTIRLRLWKPYSLSAREEEM
ncbi:hypothetical protein KOR42_54990 [Thalassoglobus neptunius]|uniref:PEP-CTERM protein-sorting domain-containing protein n=1 Tax=Thalassoglobus neptunius TaxID=1938619 RepID=A0A5C5UTX6_9PLAN|nr:hypothetical protein [Thalassoglobus neptunius]TWT29801.1 hypothetical protein KOR42_54990 [Thalassoglobus neptunius]